jgi:hypothetical protein
MKEEKLNRLTMALAIAEEFSNKVELHDDARIIVLIHDHWLKEFELRLGQIHWRFIHVSKALGPFKVLSLVDSWR